MMQLLNVYLNNNNIFILEDNHNNNIHSPMSQPPTQNEHIVDNIL